MSNSNYFFFLFNLCTYLLFFLCLLALVFKTKFLVNHREDIQFLLLPSVHLMLLPSIHLMLLPSIHLMLLPFIRLMYSKNLILMLISVASCNQNLNFGRYQNFGHFGIGRKATKTDTERGCIPIPIPKPIPKDQTFSRK